MQDTIYANRQDYDEKMKIYDSKLENLTAMIENIMDQIIILNHSPENMVSPKAQYPTTMVLAKKEAPPSEGGNSTKIGAMRTIKHEILSKNL